MGQLATYVPWMHAVAHNQSTRYRLTCDLTVISAYGDIAVSKGPRYAADRNQHDIIHQQSTVYPWMHISAEHNNFLSSILSANGICWLQDTLQWSCIGSTTLSKRLKCNFKFYVGLNSVYSELKSDAYTSAT